MFYKIHLLLWIGPINTGTMPRDAVVDLSGNGIIARCAGIDLDTRQDHPYAFYP